MEGHGLVQAFLLVEADRWLAELRISAEAVEKANPLDHFIPDFCFHQST